MYSEQTSSRNYVVQNDWPAEVFPPAPIETFAAALWLFELEPLLLSSERSTTGGPEPPLPPLASESPMDTILLDFGGSLVSLRHLRHLLSLASLLSKIGLVVVWCFFLFLCCRGLVGGTNTVANETALSLPFLFIWTWRATVFAAFVLQL